MRQTPAGDLDLLLLLPPAPPAPIIEPIQNHFPRRAELAPELLRYDPLRQVSWLLGIDVGVGLDGHREDCVLPVVHCGEFVDVAVELGEDGVKVRGLFAEQGDKDGGVVVEGIRPHVVEGLPKVLVGP